MMDSIEKQALREQAEQRFLEAAIHEIVDSAPANAATGSGSGKRTRPQARAPWLAAAALMLGSAVVISIGMMTAAPAASGPSGNGPTGNGPTGNTSKATQEKATQDKATQNAELPPAVRAIGANELAKVDAATQHLKMFASSPADLEGVSRLKQLRALTLRSVEEGIKDHSPDVQAWSDAGASALAVLAKCQRLERVSIGTISGMAPQACAALQHLPALQQIELIGVRQLVDQELVAGWSKLALRRLKLRAVRMHPDGFAQMCKLPVLQELTLSHALHLDRCDLVALGQLRQLRKLVLHGTGSRSEHALSRSNPLPGEQAAPPLAQIPVGAVGQVVAEVRQLITPTVMDAIASLPVLKELSLRAAVIDRRVLDRLPATLRALRLGTTIGMAPPGILGLARMKQLEELSWSLIRLDEPIGGMEPDSEEIAAAWITLLSKLQLRVVRYRGGIDGSLRDALARQDQLERFTWIAQQDAPADLSLLASLKKLRELTLIEAQQFDPAALAQMPALRRVEAVRASESVQQALREALRDREIELLLR